MLLKDLLQSTVIAACLMGLSSCSTLQRPKVPAPIVIEKSVPLPPSSFLTKCPENLAKINLSEERWNSLTGQEQLQVLVNIAVAEWSVAYFECSLKHNALVEWYKEQEKDAVE